jgi:2-polyprenyl-3-methyl-5-hydroxy-6-metoxy-1,4-benzoquinol methylase
MKANIWNHNIHYHSFILRRVPSRCGTALDVGCGTGLLARKLATSCREVVAIDIDRDALIRARATGPPDTNLTFEEADVMSRRFSNNSFDLITAVATLHHLPLIPALTRFRDLLKPDGVLAVVGLYRMHRPQDYVWAAAALPTSWMLRCLRTYEEVGAPLREPGETLREIRAASATVLPGSDCRRRLLFRYSLVWRKPR